MKKVSIILSHLANQPQFKFLKQESCNKKYISLLSAKWQKAIAFIYIRDNTLFVAVTHPGFKMELNYNKDLLITILKQLSSYDKSCKKMSADSVIVFHSKYRSIVKEKKKEETVPYYDELSTPYFDIKSNDSELKEKFEEIQKSIKEQLNL
jgi:hypothetical protein